MSRNAQTQFVQTLRRLAVAAAIGLAAAPALAAGPVFSHATNAMSRVVTVENPNATFDFQPSAPWVQLMLDRGLTNFTGQSTVAAAWRSLVSTQDVVGIKVFSAAGMLSGTRPAVVAAVIHGLLDAGVPPQHIVIWDKHESDLRAAGFFKVGAQLGVRVAGCDETGYDPATFYQPDTTVIGNLVWGDLEFGRKGDDVGKKSFVAKIVSQEITKIISVAPLLNQEDTGVCGHLYGLAMGSVDNTMRFANNADRLAIAVPEIYALPVLGDRVALNITDALISQYEGGSRGLLHYSEVLNQLWFSHDPVALDILGVKELDRERRSLNAPEFKPYLELYATAALLQLGVNDPAKIHVEKLR
ncbi:MAG: hypothetical protein WAO02_09610 [Verrucomicrobiia bacterium]